MKKSFIVLGIALASLFSLNAQSISLTNTFGGNSDNVGTGDFLKFDKDGNKQNAVVGDRIQLDLASENIDSRVRLNLVGPNWTPAGQAYVNFRPVTGLNFIGGNKFFWKWTTPGAYLAATDDYLTHGKLADDNGAGIVYNYDGDAFGLTLAAAVGQASKLDLNFGAQLALKNLLTIGVTAQDVSEKTRSIGAYAAIQSVKNLILNLGYTYNTSDATYIAKTQHLIQASAGYTFSDAGLSLYADAALGLNKKAFSTASDDFADLDDGLPVWGAVRANYALNEKVDLNGWVHLNHILNAADSRTDITLYPYFDYKSSYGTFRSGVRVFFDDKDGYKGFNIPISWQYKIAAK